MVPLRTGGVNNCLMEIIRQTIFVLMLSFGRKYVLVVGPEGRVHVGWSLGDLIETWDS